VPVSLKLLQTSTFRLAALYLAVFALSVGVILSYVYWNTALLIERQIEETVRAEIRVLAEQLADNGMEGLVETIRRRSDQNPGSVYLLTNFLGRRLAGNLDGLPHEAIKGQGWIEFSYTIETFEGLSHRRARAYHLSLPNQSVLVVGRDVEERRQLGALIRRTLYFALGFTVLLGLFGGLIMSRNFLHRIDSITAASRSIMAGDLSKRVPVSGSGDEIDELSGSLNQMLDQIERLMAGMREISSNVAHDLRTPLARMRARVEAALRIGEPAAQKAALERTIEEADALLSTFNALLSIARTEAGQGREGLKPVDLQDLLNEIGELYAPLAEESGGSLTVIAPEHVPVRADRQLLAQALSNLIDNALKYGVPQGRSGPDIRLDLASTPEEAVITVADRGPGIAEADRARVTERFVRLDEARSKPGSGLGLSLAQGIAKLHKGRLLIKDNRPGLRVELILPRNPSAG
jgi:signal transduction histidine kinase